jgi:hypothetical protein
MGHQISLEPRLEDYLGLGSEIYSPFPAVMLGLVTFGNVHPSAPGRINVDGSHAHDLSWTHAGEALKLDHVPDLAGDVRSDRINERVWNRFDWFRLADVGSAATETWNRFEAVMDRGQDNFFPDAPLEHSENVTDPFVNFIPAETRADHGLANVFESERPKLLCHGMAIEFSERSES